MIRSLVNEYWDIFNFVLLQQLVYIIYRYMLDITGTCIYTCTYWYMYEVTTQIY